MAAAIGAGLPVHEPSGNMIVDIGGGTTEVAVISLGGIVASQSVRIGGDELDEAIINFIKKEYSLALGERTAEEVKITLGSAWPLVEELHAEIRGRDLITGLPKTIVTSTEEIREAVEEPVTAIVDAVKVTLDKTPPELAADIMEKGIVLAGGGALLHGLDARLQHETGMPILIAPRPVALRRGRWGPDPGGVRRAEERADAAVELRSVDPVTVVSSRRTSRIGRTRVLFLLVVTSVTVLTLDFRGSGAVDDARGAASTVVSPLIDAAATVTEPFTNAWNGIFGYSDLERENEALREQMAEHGGRRRRGRGGAPPARRARRARAVLPLDRPRLGGGPRSSAGRSPTSSTPSQIDRGTDDGVAVGHARRHRRRARRTRRSPGHVVALDGRSSSPTPASTSASGSPSPARSASAHGTGERPTPRRRPGHPVNLEDNVRIRETVTTSGVSRSIFPPDIPVGRVAEIEHGRRPAQPGAHHRSRSPTSTASPSCASCCGSPRDERRSAPGWCSSPPSCCRRPSCRDRRLRRPRDLLLLVPIAAGAHRRPRARRHRRLRRRPRRRPARPHALRAHRPRLQPRRLRRRAPSSTACCALGGGCPSRRRSLGAAFGVVCGRSRPRSSARRACSTASCSIVARRGRLVTAGRS